MQSLLRETSPTFRTRRRKLHIKYQQHDVHPIRNRVCQSSSSATEARLEDQNPTHQEVEQSRDPGAYHHWEDNVLRLQEFHEALEEAVGENARDHVTGVEFSFAGYLRVLA